MNREQLKTIGLKVWKVLKVILFNKYLLTLVIFSILICFFGEHNLISRIKNKRKIDKLEQDIKYYQNKIQQDKSKINELQSSNENLEKFAREQYLMKCENEDIYIIDK